MIELREDIIVKKPVKVIKVQKEKKTQCKIIMDYLRTHKYINQPIALKMNIYRLGARIADLKERGVEFISYFPDEDSKDAKFKRYELMNP